MNIQNRIKEISAGAIVYTKHNEDILYLLIKDFHGNYGFPKGHLEKDETLAEAAIREVKEETGIGVSLDTSFKQELNYIMPNGKAKTSIYYIGYYENQLPHRQEEEVEEILLLPYNETIEILSFDNMKEAFQKADAYIRRSI